MKALSVKQPFAYFIADGAKTIETRTWETSYRGELLICSSKSVHTGQLLIQQWDRDEQKFFYETMDSEDVMADVIQAGDPLAALGMALCVVNLVDCRPMTSNDEIAAKCEVYEGAYAWVLENLRLIEPFQVRGLQKLFEVDKSPIYLQ